MYLASEFLFYFFLFPAFIQLTLGILSLRSGLRFDKYVLMRLNASNKAFQGLVTVIIPCRGKEPGLEANLKAVLDQGRGGFEAVFVVDSLDDPAVPVIDKVTAPFKHARLVVAGSSERSGQKVHNLICAVKSADKSSEAFVFADSDVRPSQSWLENMLSPLNEPKTGCSTGYRWFVKEHGGFAAHLRSAWNASIASALGPDTEANFCWGGSTAIRSTVFEELDVLRLWEGTVSDDFVLSNAIKASDYEIHFEPKCLTATIEDCTLRELYEFTTRQMKITRRYSPGHFKISLIGASVFAFTLISGFLVLLIGSGPHFWITAGFLGLIWVLGTSRAILRVNTVNRCLTEYAGEIRTQYLSHALLWPVSTFLFLFNDIAALVSRTITWRGITYELVSENEIRIVNR